MTQAGAHKKLTSQEMLAKLVSFDTTSCYSNLPLMDFVRSYFDQYGIATTLLTDQTGEKANLFATVGPVDRAGVVLSGHTDVVPVTGQAWETDPFDLQEDEGLLYGRGACDMKGFLAVALAKLPDMVAANLKSPIHFALSYDEEVGCLGAHALAAHVAQLPVSQKLCVIGEPTNMRPITGHKGIRNYQCHILGKECHSSLAPYGVNAVEVAAELIAYIKTVARRMQTEGPFNRNFDPPFTTVHVGTVAGGTSQNIVPNTCDFTFELRTVPEADPEALINEIRQYAFKHLEPHMQAIDPTTGIKFVATANVPSFDIRDDDPAVERVLGMSGANATAKVSFGTEAGIFANTGIPTVVCGPGDIEQAHKPNEFVAVEQLKKCEVFMDRLIDQQSKSSASA